MREETDAKAGNGKRILVVEDDYFIAMELEGALTRGGFLVIGPVASVEEALEKIHAELPEGAVLDVDLIGEKVTPVAGKLQSADIPFVLTTAVREDELHTIAELAQATRFEKPTDLGRLLKTLQVLTS